MRNLYKYILALLVTPLLSGCAREPMLYLHQGGKDVTMKLPEINLDLKVVWDYLFKYGVEYDWEAEWIYGWDDTDTQLFGKLGYTMPESFDIRRYYTGSVALAPHNAPYKHLIRGNMLSAKYDFGFWDILAWNDIQTSDGVQSVRIDETTSYDYVTANTGQTMHPALYNAPAYTRAFYQPEELFAGYDQGIEINENLDGFTYDAKKDIWVRQLEMELQPVTYIYLLQVILRHNNRNGRIVTAIDGNANQIGRAHV